MRRLLWLALSCWLGTGCDGPSTSPSDDMAVDLEPPVVVSTEHSHVTLVSMIAPSPDWFVGIASVNFLESGDWPDELVFELVPYDAGTDSGTIYTARDRDTDPREPIRRVTGAPFAVSGTVAPLGTFTFTRLP